MSGLLEIDDLKVEFPSPHGVVEAVDGISYTVDPGETVALVGESDCGKSISALAVLALVPQPGGRARFEDRDLLDLPEDRIALIRGREIAMVSQEPMTSLRPVLSIGVQLRACAGISACRTARPRRVQSSFCAWSASATRSGACASIRIISPAACASGR